MTVKVGGQSGPKGGTSLTHEWALPFSRSVNWHTSIACPNLQAGLD